MHKIKIFIKIFVLKRELDSLKILKSTNIILNAQNCEYFFFFRFKIQNDGIGASR